MKSIICLTSSNYGISFIYVILAYISSALSTPPPCGLYGAPPCQFVPAPAGQTPSCARPGRTYCEHVDNYPTYLIKHLVHKWGYEAKNLLVDETWDDFAALGWRETPVFYDPAFIFPQYNGGGGRGGGAGIGNNFNGYKYDSPPPSIAGSGSERSAGSNVGGNGIRGGSIDNSFLLTNKQTTEAPTFLLYTSAGQRLNFNKNHGPKVSPNNPTFWLKRIARDLSQKYSAAGFTPAFISNFTSNNNEISTNTEATITSSSASSSSLSSSRDVSINLDLLDIVGVQREHARTRSKRQTPGRVSLCQTISRFITPQAALNNKGNWMFVVNESNTARQMVKAELCNSTDCSNLCQIPNGYNSRCEQKFVQKRLIALQSNGQNLYTDSFWFPSCCVCTISPN